jgi:hypothetical protein
MCWEECERDVIVWGMGKYLQVSQPAYISGKEVASVSYV